MMYHVYAMSNPAFCGYMESRHWVNHLPKGYAAISICSTKDVQEYFGKEFCLADQHWFKDPLDNVLNIDFDDITDPRVPLDADGMVSYGITADQAGQIVQFIDAHVGRDFLIHCHAGKSRSRAVAKFIIDEYPGYESAFGEISTYNEFVYRNLADFRHSAYQEVKKHPV